MRPYVCGIGCGHLLKSHGFAFRSVFLAHRTDHALVMILYKFGLWWIVEKDLLLFCDSIFIIHLLTQCNLIERSNGTKNHPNQYRKMRIFHFPIRCRNARWIHLLIKTQNGNKNTKRTNFIFMTFIWKVW